MLFRSIVSIAQEKLNKQSVDYDVFVKRVLVVTFVRIASGWDSYSFVYTAIPTSTQFFPYMKFVEGTENCL